MSERLPKHLHDALQAVRLALRFMESRSLGEYGDDALVRSAVERQVEIVGEACRRALNDEPVLRERLPESALAIAVRNRIAHGYDSVDSAVVFNTVTASFPALVVKLEHELLRFPAA